MLRTAIAVLLVLATTGVQSFGDPVVSDSSTIAQSENNDPDDAYRLGMKYGLGSDGLDRDDAKALHLLKQARQQGHVKATYALAWLYLDGRGTPADPAEAAILFAIAANQGDTESQYMLAMLYAQGRGVVKDSVISLQWLSKAATGGHQEARKILSNLFQPPPAEPSEKK